MASGKSTAAKHLKSLGAFVIDADRLGHEVYAPGEPAHARVLAAFGEDLVDADGFINRKLLGSRVFGDPQQLRRLTDIVWPEIRRLAENRIRAAKVDHRVLVLEAAVLLEAGWDQDCDEVWAVILAPELAVQRAVARDGLAEEAVRQRLDAQMSNAERQQRASCTINNGGDRHALARQLEIEWQRVMETA